MLGEENVYLCDAFLEAKDVWVELEESDDIF